MLSETSLDTDRGATVSSDSATAPCWKCSRPKEREREREKKEWKQSRAEQKKKQTDELSSGAEAKQDPFRVGQRCLSVCLCVCVCVCVS